ncbi:hypothetical protein B484DRAFT_404246 [Ochromonadaceae sp. CCMP2298]|nr:hypothetical protein B484DRAFT_404246 [Ochromonadaceae sp. CCMP2298]
MSESRAELRENCSEAAIRELHVSKRQNRFCGLPVPAAKTDEERYSDTLMRDPARQKRVLQTLQQRVEANREQSRVYRLLHPERIRAASQVYGENNCEKLALYANGYREDNAEKIALQRQVYLQDNSQQVYAQQAQYRQANKLKLNEAK